MTTLLGQTLISTLSQDVVLLNQSRIQIGAICPYILMYNNPAGTFTFEMSGTNGVVFSKSFTSSDIKTAMGITNNYAHVFYPLIPDQITHIEAGEFTFTLSSSGYTPSENSYISWLQQFENTQSAMQYIPSFDDEKPLAIRFKDYKEGII